jgi:isopentenyl diphosphate isomerase/L-lactate dehydrogenase-like FMN-dependent dehydrogenase
MRFERGAAITRPSIAQSVRLDHRLNWDDVRWLRQIWPGKLIIRDVLAVKDANTAAELGCEAIVVSAHGGRNLDCLPAPAQCIEAIADAVKGRLRVLADSRRGMDVLKYLALGAEAGAEAVLRMVIGEMNTAMAFLGAERVSGLCGARQ